MDVAKIVLIFYKRETLSDEVEMRNIEAATFADEQQFGVIYY